jgi:hypothetical protein
MYDRCKGELSYPTLAITVTPFRKLQYILYFTTHALSLNKRKIKMPA